MAHRGSQTHVAFPDKNLERVFETARTRGNLRESKQGSLSETPAHSTRRNIIIKAYERNIPSSTLPNPSPGLLTLPETC